ncbi:MAG: AMP-binding protein [Bacteroidia bacterium]
MKHLGEIEFEGVETIRKMQQQKLSELLLYVSTNSAYYKEVFRQHNIKIENITLDNLNELPFTTKDNLATHNDSFLCVDKSLVADYVTTSGTLSDPVTFYLTSADLERLAYNEALSLQCADGSKKDIFQMMTTIDKLFMAGLAYFLGIRKLGAASIRVGPGTPQAQWDYIHRFKPSTLIAIPSFIPQLLQYASERKIDFQSTSVKKIVCLGEPVRNADFSLNELGKRITSLWDVKLYSTYASTEMSSAFTECGYGNGGHSHPELLILEVVDDNGERVRDGELGEVVVTTLAVEGMPLIRYRTGDLCHVYYNKCLCGRATTRLGPVMGRKQQMIKFKGTTLFPQTIFNVLHKMPLIELYQIEVARDEFNNDSVTVLLNSALKSDEFEHNLLSLFKSILRVTPHIAFITEQELHSRVYKTDKRKPEKIVYV